MKKIASKRIYFVDRRTTLLEALASVLNSTPDLQLRGGNAHSDAALQAIVRLAPDLLIVGSLVGDPGALRFIAQLPRDFPTLPILAYSLSNESSHVERILRAGATDHLAKETGGADLLKAIRSLLSKDKRPAVATC